MKWKKIMILARGSENEIMEQMIEDAFPHLTEQMKAAKGLREVEVAFSLSHQPATHAVKGHAAQAMLSKEKGYFQYFIDSLHCMKIGELMLKEKTHLAKAKMLISKDANREIKKELKARVLRILQDKLSGLE